MRKCFICQTTENLHRHHVYGGNGRRKVSDENGFVVDLCAKHHNMSDYSVHFNKDLDLMIKKHFQALYEKDHTREQFIELIGRNYL